MSSKLSRRMGTDALAPAASIEGRCAFQPFSAELQTSELVGSTSTTASNNVEVMLYEQMLNTLLASAPNKSWSSKELLDLLPAETFAAAAACSSYLTEPTYSASTPYTEYPEELFLSTGPTARYSSYTEPTTTTATYTTAAVAREEYRLSVRVPELGTFYLFTEPEKRIGDLIPEVERKVWELYRAYVVVHLLQDSEGIDLPFSCTVASVLQDRSLVTVQCAHAQDSVRNNAHFLGHPAPAPYYTPLPSVPLLQEAQEKEMKQYTAPKPDQRPRSVDGAEFREPPPSKVIQNKEFSFTVAIKNLPTRHFAKTALNMHSTSQSDDPHTFNCNGSADAGWGAPVPMPDDCTEYATASSSDMGLEMIIEEEGGAPLHARDFRVRCSALDKQEGLWVFFVRIKKNSHYGRTRFIIKVRRGMNEKERQMMEHAETDAMRYRHMSQMPQHEPRYVDLLVSTPVVVISKERRGKRKRAQASSSSSSSASTPALATPAMRLSRSSSGEIGSESDSNPVLAANSPDGSCSSSPVSSPPPSDC